MEKGLKLVKVRRVLQFDQTDWIKPYIDLNTKLRQEADNKFEEGFAKLMNNSFFGKYINNVLIKMTNIFLFFQGKPVKMLESTKTFKL